MRSARSTRKCKVIQRREVIENGRKAANKRGTIKPATTEDD